MLARGVYGMKVPPTNVIVVYAPYSLGILDQSERLRPCRLVVVKGKEHPFPKRDPAVDYGAFCPQGDLFYTFQLCQCPQEGLDER